MSTAEKSPRGYVTDKARSMMMRAVRQRGTSAERLVAKACSQMGLRYRVNVKGLPGSPDIANKKRKVAIFVNGCFWHGHKNCGRHSIPNRNKALWAEKFRRNRIRDARAIKSLRKLGYNVGIVWDCETNNSEDLLSRLSRILWNKQQAR